MSDLNLEAERALFEAEITKINPTVLERWPGGRYKNHGVEGRWAGWLIARRAVPARDKEAALQELTDQAQALDMGYGTPAVPAQASGGDPANPKDDSDRSYTKPIGYIAKKELSRIASGHDANIRSARFGPSSLDGDIPVYIELPAQVNAPVDQYIGSAAFKNFHRSLCARFGYTHDEQFWWRDLVSLEEHIAAQVPAQGEVDAKDAALEEAAQVCDLMARTSPRKAFQEAAAWLAQRIRHRKAMRRDSVDAAMQQPAEGE